MSKMNKFLIVQRDLDASFIEFEWRASLALLMAVLILDLYAKVLKKVSSFI